MPDEQNADKGVEESLTSAEAAATKAEDVNALDASANESTAEGGEKTQSLSDVVQEAAKAQSETEQKQEDEGVVQELDKTEQKEEGSESKGPVPYERFDEVVKEKNDFKGRLDEWEPLVKAHKSVVDYCQQNGVTAEQYQQALELVALINTNPAEALKRLSPVLENLRGFDGEILPADLAAEVASGDLSDERARELAQLRAQQKLSKRNGAFTAEQQQRQFEHEVRTSIGAWDSQKRKTDPDYKPKAKEDEPDGKYELVQTKVAAMMQNTPWKTVQDLVRITEQAYQAVNASLQRFIPANAPKKFLNSRTSSTATKAEPKTLKEVVEAAAAEMV